MSVSPDDDDLDFKREKLVRFYSDGKQPLELAWDKFESQSPVETLSPAYKSSAPLLKSNVFKSSAAPLPKANVGSSWGRKTISGSLKLGRCKLFPEDQEQSKKRILDPGSELVLQWNRVFLFSCLVALFVDPLYFYLPTIGGSNTSSCLKTDSNLRIVVTCFRTIADLFYLLHMVIKFHTTYVAPSSRVFGRGELVMDPKKISRRYLRSDFLIDLAATLPLPQIGLLTGVALAVMLFFGFETFSRLSTSDSAVLEITRSGVLFVAGSQPVNALAFVLDGLYYGVSDFPYAAYSMVLVGLITSMFLYFAAPVYGLVGVWMGLFLFMSLRVVAGLWR